ncbi:MAG: type II toxin-antitoxin system VapC family toxin [Chloroflexota bacterium]
MGLRVCVDASVAVKLVVQEPHSDRAASLWRGWIGEDIERIVPSFFPFEVASTIRRKCVRRQLTEEEAEEAFEIFTVLDFVVLEPETLLKEARDMAKELGLPTIYDTAYLALAKLCNCEFWTADRVLVNSLQGKFFWAKWIGG